MESKAAMWTLYNLVTVKLLTIRRQPSPAPHCKDESGLSTLAGIVDFEPTPYMLIIQNYDKPELCKDWNNLKPM